MRKYNQIKDWLTEYRPGTTTRLYCLGWICAMIGMICLAILVWKGITNFQRRSCEEMARLNNTEGYYSVGYHGPGTNNGCYFKKDGKFVPHIYY